MDTGGKNVPDTVKWRQQQLAAGTRSFETLRTWDGEQSRAFEELSFQLLKEDAPLGSKVIRTGNPDGGVEWYASLTDGSEVGWQAKHVHGIDALLIAMTGSVERVAKERPQLRKLIFAISWNLSTGTQGGERKSQRQKYEDKIETWKSTIAGAENIEFELVQGSNLLDRLSHPTHRGRAWFWWGDLVLGAEWLQRRFEEETSIASAKYRPELQVDVPIQEDLLALGFDSSSLAYLTALTGGIISAATDVKLWTHLDDDELKSLQVEANLQISTLKALAKDQNIVADVVASSLTPLLKSCEACLDAIEEAHERLQALEASWRRLPEEQRTKDSPTSSSSGSAQVLQSAIQDLQAWLHEQSGRLLKQATYLLSGPAGSGKTHLLLDATGRALADDRPAVFLSGARMGNGDLWAGIADQLGLGQIGADELLGAMDAAGEAASLTGCRFLIIIDALNETPSSEYWRARLPALRAKVAKYKNIALVVSCRDTYEDIIFDVSEKNHFFRQVHPGFAEREIEATERYFGHYNLDLPKIPLLAPEFSLPLFLRMFCESMAGMHQPDFTHGHLGRISVFEQYLEAKIDIIARRYNTAATSTYEIQSTKRRIRGAFDILVDHLSTARHEQINLLIAEQKIASDSEVDAPRILGLLQEEGLLVRESSFSLDGEHQEVLRVVFQAFSDFLIVKRRVDVSTDVLKDRSLQKWLLDECSLGVVEAATILFPERFQVELPDFLEIKLAENTLGAATPADFPSDRAWRIHHSLVVSLPYRDPKSVSTRTVALLTEAMPYMRNEDIYRLLFMIAPQPSHRLNGYALHRHLVKQKMPMRDRTFGFATYHAFDDQFGPVVRLARWAAGGPYPTYAPEVIELACIPLCWLLSSPNRRMRDWVSKALVQLLKGHLGVMLSLTERFWTVDDPYVVQRIIGIAYGALLRSTEEHHKEATLLVQKISDLVFTKPISADELLLDSARGIVRWGVGQGLVPEASLESLVRPYGLPSLGSPPTEESLMAKYEGHPDAPYESTYKSILYSVFSLGDFGNYVIEPTAHYFSSRNRGQDEFKDTRRVRLINSRWNKFLGSLDASQKLSMESYLKDPQPFSLDPLTLMMKNVPDPLSDEQRSLWEASWWHPPVTSDDTYPEDRIRRWIFERVVTLGWTPESFGKEDRSLDRGRGREGHKPERWGKKYQWMAYHEALARLADNQETSRRFDEAEPYEGLHQMTGERDIDISLPPIPFEYFNRRDSRADVRTDAWRPSPISIPYWPPSALNLRKFRSDVSLFLADTASEPSVSESIKLVDSEGDTWILLEGSIKQSDPFADKPWLGIQQLVLVDTFLAPKRDARKLVKELSSADRDVLRSVSDWHGHTDCCFVGEIGRHGPRCPHRNQTLKQTRIGGQRLEVVSPVELYTWEGSLLDCSIEVSATTVLPSTFIQQSRVLSFEQQGPSWLDSTKTLAFTNYQDNKGPSHGFLVRGAFLQKFLADHDLELVISHWLERMELKSDYADNELHPRVEVQTAARLDKNLKLHCAEPKRTERDLD